MMTTVKVCTPLVNRKLKIVLHRTRRSGNMSCTGSAYSESEVLNICYALDVEGISSKEEIYNIMSAMTWYWN